MKNKNKVSKQNQIHIANIREMLEANKPNFDKNPSYWAQFQKSWLEIIEELQAGGSI